VPSAARLASVFLHHGIFAASGTHGLAQLEILRHGEFVERGDHHVLHVLQVGIQFLRLLDLFGFGYGHDVFLF